MTKQAKYSISAPTHYPIVPFSDPAVDLGPYQFLSDWIDPVTLEEGKSIYTGPNSHVRAITGNLLNSLSEKLKPVDISHIDNIPLNLLEEIPGSGIAHIHKTASAGGLTVFCKKTERHAVGDFIYTLGTQENTEELNNNNNNNNNRHAEIFTYTLIDKHRKQLTLQLSIHLSENDLNVDLPDLDMIQEEDLLLGGSAQTRGVLPSLLPDIDLPQNTPSQLFKFLPIPQQFSLKSVRLRAQNAPLVYKLTEQGTRLIALQSKSKNMIFSTKLDSLESAKGLYHFELHHPIDRAVQPNLLSTNFKRTQSSLYQDIRTQAGKIYEFSFYFKAIPIQTLTESENFSVELWWSGIFIDLIPVLSETAKGYYFTLESLKDISRLELKLTDHDCLHTQDLATYLDLEKSSIVSEEQTQIKFELGFENQLKNQDQFPITVNLEPEVIISHPASYFIRMDGLSPYKKIVLSASILLNSNFILILDIEKIFTQMNISASHRHVDIIQLAHTPIYEINLSDKTDQQSDPITIAHIELKFEGGNAGLDVLLKYLKIIQ